MIERIPALLAAASLSVYWFWVVVKLVRVGRKIGKDPNAMPRERVGQAMRLLWYPCIGLLLVGLWWMSLRKPEILHPSDSSGPGYRMWIDWIWPPDIYWWTLTVPASVLCILCTLLTFVCWRKMGRSWRIGIDPNEKLDMVSTGPYRYVRHPIYALRMVINVCAFIMAPCLLVLAACAVDCLLLQIEARREERYMETKHGPEYRRYKNSVGRFVPRVFVG